MNSCGLEPQQNEKTIATLTEFIQSNPEPKELKRALRKDGASKSG